MALFTGIALCKGESAVLVATPAHLQGIERRLDANGFSVDDVKHWGQLTVKGAAETLSGFMVNDMPDAVLFKTIVGSVIQRAAASARTGKVRVYGEMVNLLWLEGDTASAGRLEGFWNEAIVAHSIPLFCAYQVEAGRDVPDELRRAHSQVIPSTPPHSHVIPSPAV